MDPLRLQVMLVTDDDALLDEVRSVLDGMRVGVDLHHLPDTRSAADFLERRGDFEGSADPDVLLLDHDGRGDGDVRLLDHLADHERLAGLPVVAFSGDDETAIDNLSEFRLHDVLPRPASEEDIHRVLSFLDQV